MRVLHFLTDIKYQSGITSFVMNLYRNIDREKVQFDFLVCTENDISYEEEIKQLGGKIFYCGYPMNYKEISSACKNIKKFFENNKDVYDVIHLHHPTLAVFLNKHVKKCGIKKRIVHSHSSMTSPMLVKSFINRVLCKWAKKYANIYWACSREAALFLYGNSFCKKHHIEIIKNGVISEKFRFSDKVREKVRRELEIEDKKVFVHVSNFSVIKNLFFLVPIIKKFEGEEYTFLFVGDGPTRQEMEERLNAKGIDDRCIFIGLTTDISKYLFASDALLLPSLKEGLPVVVVEAQATGMQCLISDTITRECNVGNVIYLPHEENAWFQQMKSLEIDNNDKRLRKSIDFQLSPFEMKNEAKRIENMYLNL